MLFFDIGFGIVLITTWMMFLSSLVKSGNSEELILVQTPYTIKFPVFQHSAPVVFFFLSDLENYLEMLVITCTEVKNGSFKKDFLANTLVHFLG